MNGLSLRRARSAVGSLLGMRAGDQTLRGMAVRGGLWTLTGYGLAQGLRLGGNLVFTRLLAPEIFGVMALVQIVVQGMQMLSDVGITGRIIQHPKGEEREFQDTAWTLQVGRGVFQWLVVLALALPVARFYGEPRLAWLIPVAGLSLPVQGFGSMAPALLRRRLQLGLLVKLQLKSQVVGLACTAVWALVHPTIWALLAGSLATALARTLLSYRVLPGTRPRFGWSRLYSRDLIYYGKWIFIASAMTYFMNQGDRIVLGKLLTPSELGVYAVAFFLANAWVETMQHLSSNVLLPVYAEMVRGRREGFRQRVFRLRWKLLALALPPACLMAILGRPIVRVLYDPRYEDAGWMLEILAIGSLGMILQASADRVLLGFGDSFRHMLLQVSNVLLLAAGILIGARLGGLGGLLIGVSTARLVSYVPTALLIQRYGVWLPKLDLAALGSCAILILVARHALHG